MTDIFLSYAHADRSRIEPLVQWFEEAGYRVWWDRQIEPGQAYDDTIAKELENAAAIVVLWTTQSITSNWVQAEAGEGLDRQVLVPVLLDDVRPPVPFRRYQTVDLIGYPRRQSPASLSELESAVAVLVKRPPQPHPQRAERRFGTRAIAASAALIGLLGVGAWQLSQPTANEPGSTLLNAAKLYSAPQTESPQTQGPRTADRRTGNYYFQPFAADREERLPVIQAFAEEVAHELEAQGMAVTRSDNRSVPAGTLVKGILGEDQLTLEVLSNDGGNPLLQRSYPLAGGLNQVQNQVVQDLSQLAGRTHTAVSYASTEAYMAYLSAAAHLRESPTLSRLERSRRDFLALTESHPKFARAWARLCDVEVRLYGEQSGPEHMAAAQEHCAQARALDDDDLEVILALANLYRLTNQRTKALDLLSAVEQRKPRSGEVARSLGFAYEAFEQWDQAFGAFEKARTLEPDYWANYNALGTYYYRQGDYSRAAEYYGQEVQLVADKSLSLNNLASALFMANDETRAVAAWRESIREGPTKNALMNLGSVAFFNQDFNASARLYRQAEQLAPEDHRVAGHLADALRAAQSASADDAYEHAIELVKQALAVNPASAHHRSDLAAYYAALGRRKEALAELDQLTGIEDDTHLVYDRALVYQRLGDLESLKLEKQRLLGMNYSQSLIDQDWNLAE